MSDETPTIEQITTSLENITELDTAALADLAAAIRAVYETERNPEDGQVNLDTLTLLRSALETVAEAQSAAAAAEAKLAAELAEIDAVMAGEAVVLSAEDTEAFDGWTDEELATVAGLDADGWTALASLAPEVETTETETETVEEPEPVVQAASVSTAPRTVRLPASPSQPVPASPEVAAHAEIVDYDTERPLTREEMGKTLLRKALSYGKTPDREVRVATLQAGAALPRMAEDDDPQEFFDRQLTTLRQYRGFEDGNVRQASGTLCAPPFVDYSVMTLGSEAQPIGSVFPRGAGGTADQMKTLRFFQAIVFDDYTDVDVDTTWGTDAGGSTAATIGIGSATATQNALALDNASSPYPKTAMRANCPSYVDCEQRASWLEIVFDNLGSMAWPEFVAAVERGGRVALARLNESNRLEDWYQAAASNGSVLTPIAQPVNANQNYVRAIIDIVSTDRSNKRDWETPYIVAQPAFADALLVQEVLGTLAVSSGTMALNEARAQIFRDYRISFVNYLDRFGTTAEAYTTVNGNDTVLPTLPADGATPDLPCQVRVGIARDDAGFNRVGDTLDLGVLRTETDLEDNDWRIFYEQWQRLCFRIPPIVADIQFNPNMLVAGQFTVANASLDLCVGAAS